MGSTITIDFHGDPLAAILDDTHGVLVPLRPLVTGMGLNWSGQFLRVQRHPILGPAVCMTQTGSDRDVVALPLDFVPGFLFGVDASRVAEAVRPKVLDYQRECFRVLAEACLGGARPVAGQTDPQPIKGGSFTEFRQLVAEARHTFGIQPARELWFKLGLPVVAAMKVPAEAEPQGALFTYTACNTGEA